MSARSYLSIGDVLTLLRQEFPDVTISKIRFLESQGLVNPERTPSGYRKFYEHDVERLRWVLRQQREHFLPLKVIKDRLDDDGNGSGAPAASTVAPADEVEADPATEGAVVLVGPGATVEADPAPEAPTALPGVESAARRLTPARAGVGVTTAPDVAAVPVERAHRASMATQAARTGDTRAASGTPNGNAGSGAGAHAGSGASGPKSSRGSVRRAPAPPPSPTATATVDGAGSTAEDAGAADAGSDLSAIAGRGGASLSMDDLCAASGLSVDDVVELQGYGLLSASVAAGVEFFDEEALAVANLAAKFAAFGIEARHLRLYKNAADREAGFIEQIVIPLVRQRNPEARARATRTAEELSLLGQQLKASLLRTALRDIL